MSAKRLKGTWSVSSKLVCRECIQQRAGGINRIRQRGLATEAQPPPEHPAPSTIASATPAPPASTWTSNSKRPSPRDLFPRPPNPFLQSAPVTLYSFPAYAPVGSTAYPSTHLLLPLRRDILHRAIVYEGDATRQGTASTKWRDEVAGSSRKIRPQKGTGGARLGDKKSPMLRGGGAAFGPRPRDFATALPRKVYDLAWRTALSYRYRRGELVVVAGEAEIDRRGPGTSRWVREMLECNGWGKQEGKNGGAGGGGGSLIVTRERREALSEALALDKEGEGPLKGEAWCAAVEDVDVKDLLKGGRVIIEKAALEAIFQEHSADLKTHVKVAAGLDMAQRQELQRAVA